MKIIVWILNILIFIVIVGFVIVSIGKMMFNNKVKSEIRQLFAKVYDKETKIITEKDLKGLPESVQRWLKNSNVVGKERIRTVRLKQKGIMRLKKEQPWIKYRVEQYYRVDEPSFIWKAKVKMNPLLYFNGRDIYYKGKGNMLIKLLSLIPVVNAKGKEIDQGTLLRYLGEIVWFPTAALSDYIKWEEVDSNSAKATMSYGEITASGIFTFNDKGDVISFTAKRYMETNGQFKLETWTIPLDEYKKFNGIRIPYKGRVVWLLDSGDFEWYYFEITDIEYNKPKIY
ncbi:DUF6544 family protein [Thermohalobacter berrensis]|uniref:Uncharacterized protein n=1 Tax=Thermohalobacter berrensis TaxID=99594 RepID=A0A419T4U7_9FIRM|nr:DUF6544 family protein [Thermohalobacter berrensis]RKD32453.1 hypothetical protein BET03_11105 [Thermohalobacter berrensis]